MSLLISSTKATTMSLEEPVSSGNFYAGLGLAISSSLFIGSSFIMKKKALITMSQSGSLRAGYGGFGYLRQGMWWLGILTMGLGELFNFTAYAFAPASLVTPLGALSVLVSAVLASRFLNEKLNLLGKLGCFLCILGSTVIVIHSPKEEEVESLNDLLEKLQETHFILYALFIIISSFLICIYIAPRHGSQNILVHISVCSGIGSLTVMACKGLGIALKETFSGQNNDFLNVWPFMFFLIAALGIFVQMNYLNKALDLFNISIVTTVYYVFFTTLVIVASSILYKEWSSLDFNDVLGSLCGFLVVIVAIFLLHGFKDMDISFNDVRGMLRPKHDHLLRHSDRRYSYESTMARSI